jgi:hypothetical protein
MTRAPEDIRTRLRCPAPEKPLTAALSLTPICFP